MIKIDKRKCIMNIKLLLNEDGTVCFGLQDTKADAKFTILKNSCIVDLKGLDFSAGRYSDKPFTFETSK